MSDDPSDRLSKLLTELNVQQAAAVLEVLDVIQSAIWTTHEVALLDYYAHTPVTDPDLLPEPPDPPGEPDEDDVPF